MCQDGMRYHVPPRRHGTVSFQKPRFACRNEVRHRSYRYVGFIPLRTRTGPRSPLARYRRIFGSLSDLVREADRGKCEDQDREVEGKGSFQDNKSRLRERIAPEAVRSSAARSRTRAISAARQTKSSLVHHQESSLAKRRNRSPSSRAPQSPCSRPGTAATRN